MPTLEQLEARQKQIQKQIQKKKNEMRKEERKARNHALMVAGGLVMQHAPGGEWKRVDWDKLAEWIDRYGYKIAECEAEELPTADAKKRLREWEAARRGAAKAAEAETETGPDIDTETANDDGGETGYEVSTDNKPQPQQHPYLTGWGGR